jgi:lysophospholipase L1-like esterase
MNKIFFHLIILLAFQLITSCEFFEGSSHIDPYDPSIEYIGRFDFSNPKSVRFDWPGVQIRTRFEGTSCSIKLKDGNNDYNVFLDGRFHKIIRTTSDTIYVVANGLPNKVHTLLITKRTEALFGIATFEGFILDGGKDLAKSIKIIKKRKIEFVGDSYFTGFCSEGDSSDGAFSRETQSSYVSFGPQLARRFDAEYSIVAISGSGVVKNYGDLLRTSDYTLPHYYEKALMNDSLLWDFNRWQPDAVVVRLGRNDYSQMPHPKREMFRTAYLKLLKDIRLQYPNAHIFALCSPLRRDPHCDYISSVVNELNGKNKDKKIHFVKVNVTFNPNRDFGCEKHPNRYGHQKIADFLEPIIRKEMKWESLLKRIFPANPFAKI